MLISDADADSFERPSTRVNFWGFSSNVSAGLLISAGLCRMSKLACSFLMVMLIPSNVSARVLMSADLCRMS